MHESLRDRIQRRLDALSDETGYQVLDYIEFLESKYAARAGGSSAFQKISETVEDTLRAGRLPVAAIRSTMDVVGAAGRVMSGLSAAGAAVLNEIKKGAAGPPVAPPGEVRPPETAGQGRPLDPPKPGD